LLNWAKRHWRRLWLSAALLLYLLLTTYQLGLPGLHYDEAAEAGVNALELLTGAPVSAFRGATITLADRQLPLMVQDYIGALNVYLALPSLGLTGIGVPNLRLVAVLTGALALLLSERAVSTWQRWQIGAQPSTEPTLAALLTVTLLAASPSFIFWSRQGIFVTNLTQPLCAWCIWQGLRWLWQKEPRALLWSAFAGGLAIYAKILAFWIVGPFVLLAGAWWLWQRWKAPARAPSLSPGLLIGASLAFLLPLVPLLLFNLETGGTLTRVTGSLGQSYYGVDNAAWLQNLSIRSHQLGQILRGDQFWYLGGSYANRLALGLAGAFVLLGLARNWRAVVPPLLLLSLAVAASLFTVSDLFVTHYALLQPLVLAIVGISAATLFTQPQSSVDQSLARPLFWVQWQRPLLGLSSVALLLWFLSDLSGTVRYHQTLMRTGGLLDHSDASYHLAYHLRYNGLGAPIALDWGFAAPIRFLSEGTVTPIEIFGYESLQAPDAAFAERLSPFLDNPNNLYLLHASGATVFAGRREQFFQLCQTLNCQPVLETQFNQRDGTPLYELWRAVPGD